MYFATETSEPLDGLSYRFLVRGDDLTKVFRVHVGLKGPLTPQGPRTSP